MITSISAEDDDQASDLRYTITSFKAYNDAGREMIERLSKRTNKRSSDYYIIKSWFSLNATTGKILISSFENVKFRKV